MRPCRGNDDPPKPYSRRHLHRLLARYRDGGLDALEPRSRRPKTTPIATPQDVRERVIELRAGLTADRPDAGPVTIAWHLEQEGLTPPRPQARIHQIEPDKTYRRNQQRQPGRWPAPQK